MTTHNKKPKKSAAVSRTPTINRAGGSSFQLEPREALYQQVATSLWSGDGYYETSDEWFSRFVQNVAEVVALDPTFCFQLAAYARDKRGLKLRASPLALFVEAALQTSTQGLARLYAHDVILRADEPGEVIGYFLSHYGRKNGGKLTLPHGLRKSLDVALRKFNEYHLAKYAGGSRSVSLRDVFRLVRPTPETREQSALWKKVVSNSLATPDTWEVGLSKARAPEEKRQVWERLIREKKLGVFAALRNLRNMDEVGVPQELVSSVFTETAVLDSGILPFQWYKAVQNISATWTTMIEQCLLWSLKSQTLPGKTLVVADNSSSMSQSRNTLNMSLASIANLLGAMVVSMSENGRAGTFGDVFKYAHRAAPSLGVLRNKDIIDETGRTTGHSTNAWTVFRQIQDEPYDRIILLSDMQCYVSTNYSEGVSTADAWWKKYKARHPGCRLYSINLASQDNTAQFDKRNDVFELAGFSETIFDYIRAMEVGSDMTDIIARMPYGPRRQ